MVSHVECKGNCGKNGGIAIKIYNLQNKTKAYKIYNHKKVEPKEHGRM